MSDKLCLGCMEHYDDSARCSCGFDENTYEVAPHHLAPGTLLQDRYMVGKVLGEGGFGITYVGRDNVLDMKIAIKEFYMTGYVNRNNEASDNLTVSIGTHADQFEKNKEKFLQEARVLAKFATERGIVGIHDFFETNNTAYIIMDFITGETLKEKIKRTGKLSVDETFKLMEPLMKSLSIVHGQNLIHRDISPDNIMLTKNGDVNLLDFGAAREVSQSDAKSLSVILKPGFAPEEQYRSKGVQGPWTDVYALCATMYCCITGVVPDDSMERMFEDALKSPHEVEPSCPPAVSDVIMKGMAVRQTDRYQNMDELRNSLEAAIKNAPVGKKLAGDANATVLADDSYVNTVSNKAGNASNYGATVYAAEMSATQSGNRQGYPVSQAGQVAPQRAQMTANNQGYPVTQSGQAANNQGYPVTQSGQAANNQGYPVTQSGQAAPQRGQATSQRIQTQAGNSQNFHANTQATPQFHTGATNKPQWANPVPGENGYVAPNMNPVPTGFDNSEPRYQQSGTGMSAAARGNMAGQMTGEAAKPHKGLVTVGICIAAVVGIIFALYLLGIF